jgi:1-deoxy-D-xylulose-5-phosphate synthase
MDRAGLSPNDGPTHHGLFDLSYLRCVPNATVMQPKDEDELVDMLHTACTCRARPSSAIPRGAGVGVPIKDAARAPAHRPGRGAPRGFQHHDLGPRQHGAGRAQARRPPRREENLSVGVVNARFVKPLDRACS